MMNPSRLVSAVVRTTPTGSPSHIRHSECWNRSYHSFQQIVHQRCSLYHTNVHPLNSNLIYIRHSTPKCQRWFSCLSLFSRNSSFPVRITQLERHDDTMIFENKSQSKRIGPNRNPPSSSLQNTSREHRLYYHTTPKQEIIPVIIIGAAIVVVGIRYSYRAVQRMKEEQEDYQYNLQIYERQQMKYAPPDSTYTTANGGTSTTTGTTRGSSTDNDRPIITMAIDLGTTYMKLATATYRPLSPITVQISREGDRSTFNGVLYEDEVNDDPSAVSEATTRIVKATGRAALERYYYPNTMEDNDEPNHHRPHKDVVSLPFLECSTAQDDTSSSSTTSTSLSIVTDVLQSRIAEVMDRIHSSTIPSTTTNKTVLVRHVVTVPSIFLYNDTLLKMYQQSFIDCCTKYSIRSSQQQQHYDTDSSLVTFIPEPVATIWGAQFYSMLPSNLSKDLASIASYCIIDVGGWTSQISIVQNDKIKYTITIPWGGECIIEQLVLLLKQEQQRDSSSSTNTLNDSRSLSLLQYHARQAVMGLASQSRVSVHVPYLYADPKQHHMETSIARNVLNQAVEDNIRNLLRHQNSTEGDTTTTPWLSNTVLSPHLPTPNNLISLWTSILTQVLEQSGQLPTNVSAVVLVGGGAKYSYVQSTIKDAWDMLTGGISGSGDKQFHFDASLSSELTVVGAATLPPSFDYSLPKGLIRR